MPLQLLHRSNSIDGIGNGIDGNDVSCLAGEVEAVPADGNLSDDEGEGGEEKDKKKKMKKKKVKDCQLPTQNSNNSTTTTTTNKLNL